MKVYLHINRFELKKGEKGFPWTIHTSKGCIRAKAVNVKTAAKAECFPKKKTNPKCFIVLHADVKDLGNGNFELVPEKKKKKAIAGGGGGSRKVNRAWQTLQCLSAGRRNC